MKYDVYLPHKDKKGSYVPGVRPYPKEWSEILEMIQRPQHVKIIEQVRAGDKEMKKALPAVCWMGVCQDKRSTAGAVPTGLVMVDIDHVEKPLQMAIDIAKLFKKRVTDSNIAVIHVTPSGKGLRVVFTSREEFATIEENIKWFAETFSDVIEGDVDYQCKDFSRLSFLPLMSDIVACDVNILEGKNTNFNNLKNNATEGQKSLFSEADGGTEANDYTFNETERAAFEAFEYRGTPLSIIIKKYVEFFGEPSDGEKHNYYNEMVKNFRCICDNNKRALLYLLPRFGHTIGECASQIQSICRVNTLSSLPKKFYFFLKDNGFYVTKDSQQGELKKYMLEEKEEVADRPPYLPPIFRELVNTAPLDFVLPSINALMPIMGTLTSYVQARYPYDDRMHTTSFFSVIYAPPSTGKGFVERFMDLLFEDLRIRDYVQSERENVYLRIINRKGANDKSPDSPHTSLRLIPPKNSEAEFLQKQKDNGGYHMFTYAAEMDSWAKGARAAGGNKDDMIRIAWDNGEYGQQFKSANTFKGTVNLYWNVLISGTLQQVENYFKNVENGLVTRCAFTSIENQEFSKPGKWKQLSEKSRAAIRRFAKRCDANTYEEPCTISIGDLVGVSDDDFDKEIEWKFKFKPRQTLDCSWIMPVIEKFHDEQMKKAALDVDRARDVFRRRVGVRGFRLALLCMCLWEKPKKSDLEKCKSFVEWYMNKDIECMLKLWGDKYNQQTDSVVKLTQRTVYAELPDTFSRNDVYVVCAKQGIKTPIRRILFDWKKLKYITQQDKDTFTKNGKEKTGV